MRYSNGRMFSSVYIDFENIFHNVNKVKIELFFSSLFLTLLQKVEHFHDKTERLEIRSAVKIAGITLLVH